MTKQGRPIGWESPAERQNVVIHVVVDEGMTVIGLVDGPLPLTNTTIVGLDGKPIGKVQENTNAAKSSRASIAIDMDGKKFGRLGYLSLSTPLLMGEDDVTPLAFVVDHVDSDGDKIADPFDRFTRRES